MRYKTEFAKRFSEALEYRFPGQSQKVRSARLGISQPTVSQMLSGERLPSTERAVHFAEVLHIKFEWLMTGRGAMNSEEATLDLLDISQLSDESKVAMRETVSALSKQSGKFGLSG